MENNEDKLIQLHELVVNQRKTIDNLTKTNQDLTITVLIFFFEIIKQNTNIF